MKPTRRMSPPGTYFVTAVAFGHRALLQSERMAELLLDTIYTYRRAGRLLLHAFVIMPDHIHLLLTPRETLERAVQLVKGGFSYRVSHELDIKGEIWERGFTDHRIRDIADFETHVAYIHMNPVRRGLCGTPEQFPHSSARPGVDVDVWTPAAKAAAAGTDGRHD